MIEWAGVLRSPYELLDDLNDLKDLRHLHDLSDLSDLNGLGDFTAWCFSGWLHGWAHVGTFRTSLPVLVNEAAPDSAASVQVDDLTDLFLSWPSDPFPDPRPAVKIIVYGDTLGGKTCIRDLSEK